MVRSPKPHAVHGQAIESGGQAALALASASYCTETRVCDVRHMGIRGDTYACVHVVRVFLTPKRLALSLPKGATKIVGTGTRNQRTPLTAFVSFVQNGLPFHCFADCGSHRVRLGHCSEKRCDPFRASTFFAAVACNLSPAWPE